MANQRLDQISPAVVFNALTYFVGVKFTGATASGYEDIRFTLSDFFAMYKRVRVKLTANTTTLIIPALQNALDIRIMSVNGGILCNNATSKVDQSGNVIVVASDPSGYSFNSGTNTVTFNNSKIAGEEFIIEYIKI